MSESVDASTAVTTNSKGWTDVVLAVLDWPFLLFVGTAVFVWLFRANVAALLGRGDIQISWGENRHIKLTEISEGIDEEIDPIREEIQLLKNKLAELEALTSSTEGDATRRPSPQDEDLCIEAKETAKKRLISELQTGKYRWRSIETLAQKAAISEGDTLDILRASLSDVVLSTGKSGKQIARHVSR